MVAVTIFLPTLLQLFSATRQAMPRSMLLSSFAFLLLSAVCHGKPSENATDTVPTEEAAPPQESTNDSILAGHSYHGEAFNEGPRQAAVLIPNLGSINFPTSTKDPEAQKFIEQGVIQLHGFWYLEAERSFRQASMIDSELAIAYWGMAMANRNNANRARGFLDEALQRKDQGAGQREKLYIDALNELIPKARKEDQKQAEESKENEREAKKRRAEKYITAMEKVIDQFPDDIEAKAFIVVQMWMANGSGVKIISRYAVDALLKEIFAVNPAHPAHHYRIHLWDGNRPENALPDAASCGPASPGIAHMWHMPGHIYSRLKRYNDAAWQQEASARVDHAHMIRTRLMPDQIHNFAHNNEWLVRNLIFVGRVNEAMTLSKNLISLPKHPRYNSQAKKGSHMYGRQRLLQVLTEYELWEDLLKATDGPYLSKTDDKKLNHERSAWIAVAQYMLGNTDAGDSIRDSFKEEINELEKNIELLEQEQKQDEQSKEESETTDTEEKPAKKNEAKIKELNKEKREIEPFLSLINSALSTTKHELEELKKSIHKFRLENVLKARWLAGAGDIDEAIKMMEKQVSNDAAQVRPLATLVKLLWESDQKEKAGEKFQQLRKIAGHADLDTPFLTQLTPLAKTAGITGDWRQPSKPAQDLGHRPDLNELGPFRWAPYEMPNWEAVDATGQVWNSKEKIDKPTVVIFYLGFGCLHCVEQLDTFSPKIQQFQDAGIDVIAVSTESSTELQLGIKNFDEPISIPLLSSGDQDAFKKLRCWDDFENQPLHGTFLIDSDRRVRWQDISYEPFNEPDFLLSEAKRLLLLEQQP